MRYVIIVREWFNRAEGNSYFTLRVVDTISRECHVLPVTYGRGLGTYYRAAEELLGHPIETTDAFVDAVRVDRKSDLHQII
jgi:hypothetical protein